MTNRIDRLVERGLVSRQTDPNDGRGILVEMSPAGLTRVDAAITRLVDAEAELLDSLPAAEQKRLAGPAAQAQPRLRLGATGMAAVASSRCGYRRSTFRASQLPRNCTTCTNTTMSSTAAHVMTGSNWR